MYPYIKKLHYRCEGMTCSCEITEFAGDKPHSLTSNYCVLNLYTN